MPEQPFAAVAWVMQPRMQGEMLSVEEGRGEDAEEFNPERWVAGDATAMQKAFNAFSFGPR